MSQPEKYEMTLNHVEQTVTVLAHEFLEEKSWAQPITIYGVPRGGMVPAYALANAINKRGIKAEVISEPDEARIIVDDIIDSGRTRDMFKAEYPQATFIALIDKTVNNAMFKNTWVNFPWENTLLGEDTGTDDIIVRLLQVIGEDPNRKELIKTPDRVIKAWKFWTNGYHKDPAEVLSALPSENSEEEKVDEMVMVHNIPVYSHCEHHLTPIIGIAHVGYLPHKKIVGLSKLARVVDMFSRRLQMQERLTNQIADALNKHLDPLGAGVIVRARHFCMTTRGAQVPSGLTTTSAMRGALLTKPEARNEFLSLCRDAERAEGI